MVVAVAALVSVVASAVGIDDGGAIASDCD